MSPPIVFGFVCEGLSDVTVFQAILDVIFGTEYEPRLLCAGDHGTRGGKSDVQRWCEQNGSKLEWILRGHGVPIDVLIIHIDADARREFKVATTKALRSKVRSWLGPGEHCPKLVIVSPKEATEAWLLAALGSPNPHIEEEPHPRARLIAHGKLLPVKNPWALKKPYYEALAAQLGQQLAKLIPAVPELGRFARKLNRFRMPEPEAPPSPAAGASP